MILVINCGSSSLKFSLFDGEERVQSGLVERIGEVGPELVVGEQRCQVVAGDHGEAMQRVHEVMGVDNAIEAIGHRIVHGGERFFAAELVTPEVERGIEDCAALAPLHNPAHLAGIRAAREYFPEVPQVVVFDTAFHQTLPERAYLYALPYELYEQERASAAMAFTAPRTATWHSGQLSFCKWSSLPASPAIWAMARRWRRSATGSRWILRWV